MGNTKGQTGTQQKRKRKSKKKKRSLIVKPKKVMIPCVTISDDSDEDDSEEGTEDTNENTENSDDENSVDVEATDDPDTDPNADQDNWKTDLAQKASEAFYQRQSGTKSLRKIVYGKEDIEDSLNPYDAVDDDDIGG